MLIITRKDGQKLLLETSDGLIEIMIDSAIWGEVKLEINAPPDIDIVREELVNHSPHMIH